MSAGVDLLGDPLPDPLPSNSRLLYEDELRGHEIRAVFMDTLGIYGQASMVMVTATGCWIVFDAEADSEGVTIKIDRPYSGTAKAVELIGYVPAQQLLDANCISTAEFARLKAIEDEDAAAKKATRANHLRNQLAELEGGAP